MKQALKNSAFTVIALIYAQLVILIYEIVFSNVTRLLFPSPEGISDLTCQFGGCVTRDLTNLLTALIIVPLALFPFYRITRTSIKEDWFSSGILKFSDLKWLGYVLVFETIKLTTEHGLFWKNAGRFPTGQIFQLVLGFVLLFSAGATPEELVSRAFLQSRFQKRFGPWIAIFLSTLFFVFQQLARTWPIRFQGNFLPYFWIIAAGLMLGVAWFKTRRILIIVLMHALMNIISATVILNWVDV